MIATADHIAAKKRSGRKLKLSFDEWNVWYEQRFAGHTNLEWETAPRLIEDEYTVRDAVVVGNLLMCCSGTRTESRSPASPNW